MPDTLIDEIADGIYRLSTFVADVGPTGFTFNQFLIDDDEPLLFHTGQRMLFDSVSEAVATVVPIETLRWITFGHIEADECGSMNQFLAAAPRAEVAHGGLGCMVSLNDLADRPPVPLANGQVLEARDASGAAHRHTPRPTRLGSPSAVRGDHQNTPVRRSVHPTRPGPRSHLERRARCRSTG